MIIEAENIHKSFGALDVLKGIDFKADGGEIVSIMGASGAGKTTLLEILGTLSTPSSGSLLIDGTDVLSVGSSELAAFRARRIGFVFQFHHLLPEFTALENVMNPAMIAGKGNRQARADEPIGNLDSATKEELYSLIFRLREELGQTFIIVTHDPSLSALCDRTMLIKDGLFIG